MKKGEEHAMRWILISYDVPITPSKNRVYVWRKLKELGAEYLKQGVALLPMSKSNLQRAEQLAGKIRNMEGTACLGEMHFLDETDEKRVIQAFKRRSANEFRELMIDIARLYEAASDDRLPMQQKVMSKRYGKLQSRDYFGTEEELNFKNILAQMDFEGGISGLINDLKEGSKTIQRKLVEFLSEPPLT
jgi:hypothetical protein